MLKHIAAAKNRFTHFFIGGAPFSFRVVQSGLGLSGGFPEVSLLYLFFILIVLLRIVMFKISEREFIVSHCNRFVNFFFFNPDTPHENFAECLFEFG
ncbi:MAG: hypothetical protein IJ060_11925 [Oscillospiraceae bacterium]|nr:hypothetical protein [Oscillospiraceae bacterium]